jgi:hypothetical protein
MNTYTPTNALIDALATYRATKLVIDDEITADLRDKAYEQLYRLPDRTRQKVRYLLSCPWCVSIWAAAFLVGLRILAPDLATYLNTLLAASAVTGIVYTRID